jgi:hypothetical protein
MRLASLKNEPGAVLHAMHLESIVCLSVEVIEKLQRGRNYKTEKEMKKPM